MTKKVFTGTVILILAALLVPSLSPAQSPAVHGLDISVSYQELEEQYVLTATVTTGATVIPEWVLVDFTGATRSALVEADGVLDHLTEETSFLRVQNVWGVQDETDATRYTAYYELPSEKMLPPDGLLIVHAEAYSGWRECPRRLHIPLLTYTLRYDRKGLREACKL